MKFIPSPESSPEYRMSGAEADRRTAERLLNFTLKRFEAIIQESREQAYVDKLTGLPNGFQFEKDLQKRCERIKTQEFRVNRLGLIIVDADGLKRVNDHPDYGYQRGNEFLLCIAESLQEVVRNSEGDQVYRMHNAGDEFAALIYVDSRVDASSFVELGPGREAQFKSRLYEKLADHGFSSNLGLGASFGMGFYGSHEYPSEFQHRVVRKMQKDKKQTKELLRRQNIGLSDDRE